MAHACAIYQQQIIEKVVHGVRRGNLRLQVKQIQDEYQSFMEGVRGRAQGAIDQANALFQAYRGDATSQLDAAIHYLQSRFFSFSVSPALS